MTPDHVRETLEKIRAARGFVLPHHGAMAAALPELHGAYEAMYRALTLEQRHLSPLEKEVVWVAILAACEEPVGTHHVAKFRAAGGTDAMAGAVFRLAGWAAGARRYACLSRDWQAQFPGVPATAEYIEGARVLLADGALPEAQARLALVAIHTACDEPWGLAAEIEAAYAAGAPEPCIAEAMSLAIWPRGVNPFVRATEVWLRLIRDGRVVPSAAFRAWADAPGQGRFEG
jgi:alkylhydroperoxidase/carboxymuconolactone decarboxylase family protein YurZ